MKLHLSRRRFLAGTAAASGALLAGRPGLAQEQAKVGFVYVGPIGDYGWTHRPRARAARRWSSTSATRSRRPTSRTSPKARMPSG